MYNQGLVWPPGIPFNIEGKTGDYPLPESLFLDGNKYQDLLDKIYAGLGVPKELFTVDSISVR